jgi:NADPH2:quinone reductase
MARSITIAEHGSPEVMRLTDQNVGEPEGAFARVAVSAAGVNFIDTYFRSGSYPAQLPLTLGLEGAGTVEAVGPDVSRVAIGDRVAWTPVPGSYCEQVLAAETSLVKIPDEVATDVAAASMLQGMTAHYLVHGCRNTSPGDIALVHAAAGGAGQLTVQTLKHAGARVIGTCSTTAKADSARAAGCDDVILYSEVDFADEVRSLTDGRGVDVVYDGVGRTTFEKGLTCLAPRGLMCLFGYASGRPEPLDIDRLQGCGSVFVTRPSLFHYTLTPEEYAMRAGAVFAGIAEGWLRIHIGARFSLEQAADAHRALEGRSTTGKVLLDIV